MLIQLEHSLGYTGRGMEAEKPQPVVSLAPHLLTIAKPQRDQSVTTLQSSMERNRWVNEQQPKETRVGFKKPKYQKEIVDTWISEDHQPPKHPVIHLIYYLLPFSMCLKGQNI